MDALIAAAARALAAGDALGALQRVALRDDPSALALRGIAMAQLGEHARARDLLRRASRAFGPREALARARCALAQAEVALAMRDLGSPLRGLATVAATLELHGDRANAAHARLLAARHALLLGRLGEAAASLAAIDPDALPPTQAAVADLARAELAMRSLQCASARACLERAGRAAQRSGIAALVAEVAHAAALLDRPAARRINGDGNGNGDGDGDGERLVRLDDVEALLASDALVLDACRRGIAMHGAWRPLARRPILFALARSLAAAWPGDVDRDALIATAFRMRDPDETHRARLRVEIGRLRALAREVAAIEATPRGFALRPRGGAGVVVLAPPIEGGQAALLALLSDGAAWSTSALALALDASQRTVQRGLADLQLAGQARAVGQARARRWLAAPLVDFTTVLLLPASLPGA